MNTSMKAVVNTKYGPPDILRIVEVEKPMPDDKEVLIKINTTTVETTDMIFRGGKQFFARMATGITKPKDTTPGSEFAGEIEAVGQAVTMFKSLIVATASRILLRHIAMSRPGAKKELSWLLSARTLPNEVKPSLIKTGSHMWQPL